MKKGLFLLITLILIVPGFCRDHEQIVEKVDVTWWQVPFFAVDKDGNAVTDLLEGDIDLYMNNRQIKAFNFYKRSFSVTQRVQEDKVLAKQPATGIVEKPPPGEKKKIFLLFDVAVSDKEAIRRSKRIAKTIIMNANRGTRFIILTIEPFVGLNYTGEAAVTGGNKKKLLHMVEDKVIERTNIRLVDPKRFIVQIKSGRGRGDAFTAGEMRRLRDITSKDLQRKYFSFFNAFETLYFYLNAIEENKIIYLFSEGPSRSVITSSQGGRAMYNFLLEKVADYLGRSGAVLFIINPMGVTQPLDMTIQRMDLSPVKNKPYEKISGEAPLRYLARESGGKYIEGVKEEIAKKLKNMHRAYYEISFPDIPGIKKNTRTIAVKSKRKGVSIHSLRSLEKSKCYKEMKSHEKELLALNLITRNPSIKTKMPVYSPRIDEIKKSKKKVVYRITIPGSYLNETVDLYKFRIKENQEILEVAGIEKESLKPLKNKMKIEFKIKGTGTEKHGGGTHFVLVNVKADRALVVGIAGYEEDPEIFAGEKKQQAKGEKTAQINPGEMKRILQGAAGYCEKLKKSVFHFFCIEKIVEKKDPISFGPNIVGVSRQISPNIRRRRRGVDISWRNGRASIVTKYKYTYRLIKKGSKIKEERERMSSKGDSNHTKIEEDKVIKLTAFISEKAIFAPLTLLSRQRQDKYYFRFIRFDNRKGRPAAVIEGIPKRMAGAAGIYGKIWIDMEDFSVLKIEADPTSIKGYDRLKKRAKIITARLELSLETEFDQISNGIRFPTKVLMVEKYKGGKYLVRLRGPRGWERNRTVFTYNDYQFFDVQMRVTVDK